MVKKKSKAVILVADGTGGMSRVEDRRFEAGDWPIQFEVAEKSADRWLTHLGAECRKRGWQHTAHKQMDHGENSGTVTVKGAEGGELLSIVWERRRDGPLRVKARSTIADTAQLIETVDEN